MPLGWLEVGRMAACQAKEQRIGGQMPPFDARSLLKKRCCGCVLGSNHPISELAARVVMLLGRG
jgi:hypothetical protein